MEANNVAIKSNHDHAWHFSKYSSAFIIDSLLLWNHCNLRWTNPDSIYPSTRITDETDEEGRQFGPPNLRRNSTGDSHKTFSTSFPHTPNVIRAQLKKLWNLPK